MDSTFSSDGSNFEATITDNTTGQDVCTQMGVFYGVSNGCLGSTSQTVRLSLRKVKHISIACLSSAGIRYLCTYVMRTYIHTYIHTCLHTCMHTHGCISARRTPCRKYFVGSYVRLLNVCSMSEKIKLMLLLFENIYFGILALF